MEVKGPPKEKMAKKGMVREKMEERRMEKGR